MEPHRFLFDETDDVVGCRVPANHLLDRVLHQGGVGRKFGPLIRVPGEGHDGVGDLLGGRLEARSGNLSS